MSDQPHWMRLPHGPERNAAWARWTLGQLEALKASPLIQRLVHENFVALGLLPQCNFNPAPTLF